MHEKYALKTLMKEMRNRGILTKDVDPGGSRRNVNTAFGRDWCWRAFIFTNILLYLGQDYLCSRWKRFQKRHIWKIWPSCTTLQSCNNVFDTMPMFLNKTCTWNYKEKESIFKIHGTIWNIQMYMEGVRFMLKWQDTRVHTVYRIL